MRESSERYKGHVVRSKLNSSLRSCEIERVCQDRGRATAAFES